MGERKGVKRWEGREVNGCGGEWKGVVNGCR